MSLIYEFAQQLQDTSFGTALAESRYAFPIIEGFHLIGLSLSVGLIGLIDLRLVGWLLRDVPRVEVLRSLRPWVLAGFALTFLSGSLLFSAEATTVLDSPVVPFKFLFIVLAGANALYFELKLKRLETGEGDALEQKHAALFRTAGLASLGLWALVVTTGRLIPYIPH